MLHGLLGFTLLFGGACALIGCGEGGKASAGLDGATATDTPVLAATCTPEGERHYPEPETVNHVASLAGQRYNSTPPSSGSHCPVWGQRGNYTAARPLPRCNWLH